MILQGFTVGNKIQEKLLVTLAGVVGDYAFETAGPREHTDELIVMGVIRRSLRNILPCPLKEIDTVHNSAIPELFRGCINDLVDYFSLEEHQSAITETCQAIYEEWKKRLLKKA